MDEIEKRGRGRPVGSVTKRDAQFQHYNPKRWHPEFNLIVIESIAGKSNAELSELFGYTPQHISNILSSPQASGIRDNVRNKINSEFDGQLKSRLASIGEKAIKHIESFVEDENSLATKSPFQFLDRVIRIQQVIVSGDSSSSDSNSKGNVTNNTIVQGNAIIMNGEQANNIRDALLKSASLDSINPGDVTPERNLVDDMTHRRLKIG